MPSQIDATIPISGKTPGPTTASVRLQFQRAASELTPLIDANLPTRMTTAEGGVSSLVTRMTTAETKITVLEAAGPGGNGSGDGAALAALATRVTLAEGNITSLLSRMGTAEGNVTSLLSRMGTAEGNVTSLLSRMGTAEGNVGSLTTRITTAEGKISALEAAGPGSGGGLPTTGGTLTGALAINTSGTTSTLPSTSSTDVALGLAGNNFTAITIDAASTNGVPRILMRRAGGSVSAPTNVQTGWQLGSLEWQGYFNAWTGGGTIECVAQNPWSAASTPTRMNFRTTRTNSNSPTTAMWIGTSGGFVVGAAGGGDMGPGTMNVQDATYLRNDVYVYGTLYINDVPVPQP